MRKISVKFALIILLFISLPVSYSSATDLSLGASTWYSWWDFKESDMGMDPAFLYGPLLSVNFNNPFSISCILLYGEFKSKNEPSPDGGSGGPEAITRFDTDTTLNYNFNRYLKIFTGVKYMGFSWKEEQSDGTHYSVGPGLGVGATIPLFKSIYLLLNASYTYALGKHEQSYYDGESNTEGTDSVDLNETCYNTNATIAYYIQSASTSLNLGFRYQYVISDYKEEKNHMEDDSFSFYGVTFSAVYSFQI